MTQPPHVPAAFINVIADEGTKAEAVEWLQRTWNELCQAERRARALQERLAARDDEIAALRAALPSETADSKRLDFIESNKSYPWFNGTGSGWMMNVGEASNIKARGRGKTLRECIDNCMADLEAPNG